MGIIEFKKQPRRQMEYWALIQQLGEFVAGQSRLQRRGLPDKDGSLKRAIQDAQETWVHLVQEACLKFGLAIPDDCPPPASYKPSPRRKLRNYFDWSREMGKKVYAAVYKKLICSRCPFSTGIKRYYFDAYPCSEISGVLKVNELHVCGMVHLHGLIPTEGWNEAQFVEAMREQGGDALLRTMRRHQRKTKRWLKARGAE